MESELASMCFEAFPCRKSESRESKDKTSKKECAYSAAISAATKCLKVKVSSALDCLAVFCEIRSATVGKLQCSTLWLVGIDFRPKDGD